MSDRPVLELPAGLAPGRYVLELAAPLPPAALAAAISPVANLARPTLPAWLSIAFGEIGVKEITGGENVRIMEYHRTIDPSESYLDEDEDPWCASFVGWVLQRAGIKGTGSAAARSYEAWGEASPAREGAIAVFYRGDGPRVPWDPKKPTSGHVAILLAESSRGVHVLGGNQANGVTVATFSKKDLIGYRWPRGTP